MDQQPLFTTRREFLSGSLALLSASATLPLFLGHTAASFAQSRSAAGRRSDSHRILVVIQLAGGNDGLNTVVPHENPAYYQYRRTLAIPRKDVLPLGQGVGLHPSATGLKALFDEGRLAIVQGVGYPNPNRSHFTSMDIWHTADPQQRQREGWLGRYFDNCCAGADPGPDPALGIALMAESPLAMQGARFQPLAFSNPDELTWRPGQRDARAAAVFRQLNNIDGPPADAPNPLAAYLQRAALDAQVGTEKIRSATGGGMGRRFGPRGGQLAQQLRMVARMIAADLPSRIYYVSMGGFDTHAGQLGQHAQLLDQFGTALKGFIDQLAEDGLLDRVLVLTFSEFGRRVQENASGGTDHGEAAPVFLCGSRLRPGLHQKHPDLTRLNRGDLAFGCDFRRVYATVLRDWLQTRPEQVLGQAFGPLPLLRR